MSSCHEWLLIHVHEQTCCDNIWDEKGEYMQKDVFVNRRTNNACKDMCSRIDGKTMHARTCERMDDHSKMCSLTDEKMMWAEGWTSEHVRRYFHEWMNMSSMPKYKKGAMRECNIKQTQSPLKTPHTMPCEGKAMTRHEDIHVSTSLQLDMHTNSNVNVPTLSCWVVSWVMLATSLLWAILCQTM